MKKLSLSVASFLMAISLFAQAPEDWFHRTPSSDGYYGVGSEDIYSTLLAGMKSETVVVAIIDSGIDIDHEDLKDVIWVNSDEIPNNGKDDDNNGYVDDVHGWNFIGGANGDVGPDTYEVTRLYKKYKYKYENANESQLSGKQKEEYKLFKKYRDEVNKKLSSAQSNIDKVNQQKSQVMTAIDAVIVALDGQEVTMESLDALSAEDESLLIGKNVFMGAIAEGRSTDANDIKEDMSGRFEEGLEYYNNQVNYAYNTDFDTRDIVGDNYADQSQSIYGNNNVEGETALHGTHVGGIVGMMRGNDIGNDGVADNVRLMSIRTVPDGDERDKDVANAIRYAVDNGASIINMSFGKGYSWNKEVVDSAVKYAEKNDVLLVHAAGNSAQDNDNSDNFPTDQYERTGFFKFLKKKEATNWIEVGALSYNQGQDFSAPFSNYGATQVDLFAPGMSIYATVPDDKYRNLQGTSMAAPVVAGVAAILRSYFPGLTAVQVKSILMSTVTKIDQEVLIPGKKGETTNFSNLSVAGGTVNAKRAVKKAKGTVGKKKIKSGSNRA